MTGDEWLPVRHFLIWGERVNDPANNPVTIADEEIERVPDVWHCGICGARLTLMGICYRDPMWVFECDGGRHRHLVGPKMFGGDR